MCFHLDAALNLRLVPERGAIDEVVLLWPLILLVTSIEKYLERIVWLLFSL